MVIYVCMYCRKELYREGDNEFLCEDHPWAPADYVNIPDNTEEAPQ